MTDRSSSRLPSVPSTTTRRRAHLDLKSPVCLDQDVLPGNAVGQMLTEPLSHCLVMAREAERYPISPPRFLDAGWSRWCTSRIVSPFSARPTTPAELRLKAGTDRMDGRRVIARGFGPDLEARFLDLESHDRADNRTTSYLPGISRAELARCWS